MGTIEPESYNPSELKGLNAKIPKELSKKVKLYCTVYDLTVQNFVFGTVERRLKESE